MSLIEFKGEVLKTNKKRKKTAEKFLCQKTPK
jgi:hypothetical protein